MTDKIDPKAYAEPCGCGAEAGESCPHTPIRCKHEFWYGDMKGPAGPWQSPPSEIKPGLVRTCELCGLQQSARVEWATQRAAYGSPTYPTE